MECCQTLKLPCYCVLSSNTRIASVGAVLKTYPGENTNITQDSLALSGNPFEQRPSITVRCCPRTQLPFAVAEIKPGKEFKDAKPEVCTRKLKSSQQLKPIGSLTDSDNYNLSQPQKELLQWHYCLGHIGMKRIQWLFCRGSLSTSKMSREQQKAAAKLTCGPLCTACLLLSSNDALNLAQRK